MAALWLRSKIQTFLFDWGAKIQENAKKYLLVGVIILTVFAFFLHYAKLETRVEKLWVEGKPAAKANFFLSSPQGMRFINSLPTGLTNVQKMGKEETM